MTLTYDDVWSTFLDNYKVNDEDLPQHEQTIYNDIRNAVMMYNNRLRTCLQCNDASETIEGATTQDERLLIAHFLKLVYLNNEKVLYESLYQPISPDVGVRNYSSQMNALETSIEKQEDYVEKFIFNTQVDFL